MGAINFMYSIFSVFFSVNKETKKVFLFFLGKESYAEKGK